MLDERGRRLRWSNVPIPEPHVAGLIGGLVIHLLEPWRAFGSERPARATGVALVGLGVAIIERAVRTTGEQELATPRTLVTSGPYAYSRNPMYLAWTTLYVGVALLVNTMWPFVWLPVVLAVTHWLVRREERSLDRTFGDEYRAYQRDVERYL